MTRMAGANKGLNNFLAKTADYGAQGAQSIANAAQEVALQKEAEALVESARIQSQAEIEVAKANADYSGQVASSQNSINTVSAFKDGVQGALGVAGKAGAFSKPAPGSNWMDAGSIGFPGNQVNGLGRIRY